MRSMPSGETGPFEMAKDAFECSTLAAEAEEDRRAAIAAHVLNIISGETISGVSSSS